MDWNEKQLQLLATAERLFAQKGFEGTSVRDIAQEAGVNVAMISYYFGSKQRLLQSLIRYQTGKTATMLHELSINPDLDPWEKVNQIIDYYVDRMLDNRNFHAIISRQISLDLDQEVIDMIIEVKKRNTALISSIIEEGQKRKLFGKVNVPLTISSVIGTIAQVTMSRPFYSSLLQLKEQNDAEYFKKINPKLKQHLKQLLQAYLRYQP